MDRDPRSQRWPFRALAAFLCGLVVFCAALASSDALHRLVHGDDGDDGPQAADSGCALCLFAHSHLDSAAAPVTVAARQSVLAFVVPLPAPAAVPAPEPCGFPSRGPPLPRA